MRAFSVLHINCNAAGMLTLDRFIGSNHFKPVQFLSQLEELDAKYKILVAIFCKVGVSVPYNCHQDAKINENNSFSYQLKQSC